VGDAKDARAIILERRKFFIASALAGLGIGSSGCEKSSPHPCLSEPMVCLSQEMPQPDRLDDAGAQSAEDAPDAGASDGGATIATDPTGDANATDKPDAGKVPVPRPVPEEKPPPRPCLRMAPPRVDKQRKG
jgi:hypothetical protein